MAATEASSKSLLDQIVNVSDFIWGGEWNGAEVIPFKPSLLDLPASEDIPVHSAIIHYATEENQPPAHQAICWWGDMEFAPHMSDLLRLPHFNAKVTFLDQTTRGKDRKELATTLHQKISSQFVAVE